MDFENDILELANQCIAAMQRDKPSDPIVYSREQVKKSFGDKFNLDSPVQEKEKEQVNYFRPNFNMP